MPSRTELSTTDLKIKNVAKHCIVPSSFILPILILYVLYPLTFETVWKGHAPYLFFLWLFALELVLGWEKLPKNILGTLKPAKILAVAAALVVPTVYVIGTSVLGLERKIVEIGRFLGLPFGYSSWLLEYHWPLSLEYLVLAVFFILSVWLVYGITGLKRFSVSLFFLGAIAFFYTIDTFYPYGVFTALQSLVPIVASSVNSILKIMGYETLLFQFGQATKLFVKTTSSDWMGFIIYWPCAGVHSLLIYTFIILLFLKNTPFSLQRKVIYASIPRRLKFTARNKRISFLLEHKIIQAAVMAAETFVVDVLRMVPIYIIIVIGAVGTFIVNVLRIVSICTIAANIGPEAAQLFHNYYGELFFIAWIVIYFIVLLLLSGRIRPRLPVFRAKRQKPDENSFPKCASCENRF